MNLYAVPKTFNGINFNQRIDNAIVNFEGNFGKNGGIRKLDQKVAKLYGECNGEYFLAIDMYKFFAEIVLVWNQKYPDDEIKCTIDNTGNQTEGTYYDGVWPDPNSEWDLGLVVFKLDKPI